MSDHDDIVRLRHMREYALEIVEFTQGKTLQALTDEPMLERALSYDIGIIGEAASKVTGTTRAQYAHIPWKEIVGMRTYLFHIYFHIDSSVLWETATVSIPQLILWLDEILPDNSTT